MKAHVVILLVWGASFLLPVLRLESVIGIELPVRLPGPITLYDDDGSLVGHEAAVIVLEELKDVYEEHGLKRKGLGVLSELIWHNLANPLYVAAFLMALRGRWWTSVLLGAAATGAAAYWLHYADLRPCLQLGYWVWLGAMAAATLASLARAVRRTPLDPGGEALSSR